MAIKTEYKGHTIAVHPDGTFEVTAYGETFGSEKDARKYLDQHVASAAKKSVPLMDLIKGTHPDVLKAARLSKAGGEGSRGGKVIAHTGSGKPIYEKHESYSAKNPRKATKRSHEGWNQTDHRHAASHHNTERLKAKAELKALQDKNDQKHGKTYSMLSGGIHPDAHPDVKNRMRELNAKANHHTDAADAHWGAGGGEGSRSHFSQRGGGPNVKLSPANQAAAEAQADKHFNAAHGGAKPTTQAELDATPTPAQAVGTRFKQLPKVKKSIEKGAGILQLDNVFASEDAGNQKMSKMGVSASPMTVAASEDPAIDGESPTGRGSKSFGLQYSKRVRKHYGLPD